jgi:hypothetical protein
MRLGRRASPNRARSTRGKAIKCRHINSTCWSLFLGSKPELMSIYSAARRIYGLVMGVERRKVLRGGTVFTLRAAEIRNYDSFAVRGQSFTSREDALWEKAKERVTVAYLHRSSCLLPNTEVSIRCHYTRTCCCWFSRENSSFSLKALIWVNTWRHSSVYVLDPFQATPEQGWFSTSASALFALFM